MPINKEDHGLYAKHLESENDINNYATENQNANFRFQFLTHFNSSKEQCIKTHFSEKPSVGI